jgi:hypothetical protein
MTPAILYIMRDGESVEKGRRDGKVRGTDRLRQSSLRLAALGEIRYTV